MTSEPPTSDEASPDVLSSCYRQEGLVRGSYDPLTLALQFKSIVREVTEAELHHPVERSEDNVIFFHEHSHLLQEVTTLYGLACFATYFRVIAPLATHCQQTPVVRLPVAKGGHPIQAAEEWLRWRAYIEGVVAKTSTDPPFNTARGYEIVGVDTRRDIDRTGFGRVTAEEGFPMHAAVVTVKQGALYDIHVGAHAISESLSHMLDGRLYDAASIKRAGKAPPYPYEFLWSLARFIAKKHGVQRAPDPTLATFGDRALMTLSPGYFVTKYLEEYARRTSRPAHDICDEVERTEKWSLNEPLSVLREVFSDFVGRARVSDQKTRFMRWFNGYITRAIENRRTDRDFYLKPFLSDDPWARCEELRRAVPPPLMIDGANKLYSDEGEERAEGAFEGARWFQSIKFVIRVLTEHSENPKNPIDIRCPIRDSCTHRNPKDDERCVVMPWVLADTVIVDKETGRKGSCAIGSAFAFFGIKNGKPVERA